MSKDSQAQRARKDLAHELKLNESEVRVASVKETEWRDASLGVAAADMFSAQVITPGYIIELEAQGKKYRYHADEGSRVVRAS
jgi:hypothetical protein